MIIKKCIGYELEKSKSNSPEEFFNRSEVTFVVDGEEKNFHLLYLRYFDEKLSDFTPYTRDPLFTIGDVEVRFRDVVGLVCLLGNPNFRDRKRIYINSEEELAEHMKKFNFHDLQKIFIKLLQEGTYSVN